MYYAQCPAAINVRRLPHYERLVRMDEMFTEVILITSEKDIS
jgi:hypothetical protein